VPGGSPFTTFGKKKGLRRRTCGGQESDETKKKTQDSWVDTARWQGYGKSRTHKNQHDYYLPGKGGRGGFRSERPGLTAKREVAEGTAISGFLLVRGRRTFHGEKPHTLRKEKDSLRGRKGARRLKTDLRFLTFLLILFEKKARQGSQEKKCTGSLGGIAGRLRRNLGGD